jgi:hypothetical protein
MAFMRLVLPAVDRVTRASLPPRMRAAAPAEAFQVVLEHAARLVPEDFADLSRRLGLAS